MATQINRGETYFQSTIAISYEEEELCMALKAAVHGSIPFDSLPNHGENSTTQSETEACNRFHEYMSSDLADYINQL